MGDIPEGVPSLEELGDGDDLPEYWAGSTTITVDRWVKESLDEHRDERPWNQYLEKLRREHADPITFNDVERMAEVLAEELDEQDSNQDELAREVSKQFDYVNLAEKVAERVLREVQG